MSDRVLEVVEDTHVVHDVDVRKARGMRRVFHVAAEDGRVEAQHRGAHDRLHHVLHATVDGRHAPAVTAQPGRVDAFEAADLEHGGPGQTDPAIESHDARIRDRLGPIALADRRRRTEPTSARIDREAVPRKDRVELGELGVR
jgi:hypothetical protein